MTDQWDDLYTCPVCHKDDCVPPYGKKNSPVLIIGDAPGDDELKTGRPFSGATGKILRIELAKLGVDVKAIRLCNIWYHKPNASADCLDFGFQLAIKEAKDRKAVLLIGAEVVKKFTGMHVSEVTGLEVKSSYLSAPLVMACVQPAVVFHDVVGDFRLSLKKFVRKAEAYL